MTRDILETIVLIAAITEGIAMVITTICSLIALKNQNSWVGKSLKVGFIMGTISQFIISITAANPALAMLLVLVWIVGYIKIHKWVEEVKLEHTNDTDTIPRYLQAKLDMEIGKVKVTEVPYDAVHKYPPV